MSLSLKNVNLIVADVARSRTFYVDVLGLAVDDRRSAPPDFLFLDAGGCGLSLQGAAAANETAGAGPGMEIGFEVGDVAAVADRLRAAGYADVVVQTMGWGSAVSVRDPDGHRLNLFAANERW